MPHPEAAARLSFYAQPYFVISSTESIQIPFTENTVEDTRYYMTVAHEGGLADERPSTRRS